MDKVVTKCLFVLVFSWFLLLDVDLLGQTMDMYGNKVKVNTSSMMQFESDAEVAKLVSRIMDVYNLPNRYILGASSSISNCVADKDDSGRPLILYNPDFIKKIKGYSFTSSDMPKYGDDWGVLLVLAHEIGHHLKNHIVNPHPDMTQREKELEADETAGYVLYLLGAPSLSVAQQGLQVPQVSEQGTYTHPPRAQRLAAFNKGWETAAVRYPRPGTIQRLNCSDAQWTGTIKAGEDAVEVRVTVPYTGGDGGQHFGESSISQGVNGLTATLAGGRFAMGDGKLEYVISGRALSSGMVRFELSIGGKGCTITVLTAGDKPVIIRDKDTNDKPPVNAVVDHKTVKACGAYVAPGVWKAFMCHNLGAKATADPFTPSWELIGDYYQWGRRAVAAKGPSGPGASQANGGAITGWNSTGAPDKSWRDDIKTANDPCPVGYSVPTKVQWDGVLKNNQQRRVGTWDWSSTNYSSGIRLGESLFLPAAGYRDYSDGELNYRGYYGYYWSSTEISSGNVWDLYFNSSSAYTNGNYRAYGFSVRCIAE
jgi:uncharacterized protein (TIGR02145 family)